MNIALLSGAYKNAGDFLIVSNCEKLLLDEFPGSNILKINRSESLEPLLDDINQTDVLVFGGGPAYEKYLYPYGIPLVEDLNRIKVPFFALGLGWFGDNSSSYSVYQQEFTDKMLLLLNRFGNQGFSSGCRDYYSQRILKKFGFSNTIMTGCPAWYDLDLISTTTLQNNGEIKKILISDPASECNFSLFLDVVEYIKSRYPSAEITVVFHRGVKTALQRKLDESKVSYINISDSTDGFAIYRTCDLHIGFRVHAHIYSLSQRHRSILIEEDGRGAGVNDALGLRNITAYDPNRITTNLFVKKVKHKLRFADPRSEYLTAEIDDYIDALESQAFIQFTWAFERMQYYYGNMRTHIRQLNSVAGKS